MNVIGPQISLLLLFSIITIISIEFYHLIHYFFYLTSLDGKTLVDQCKTCFATVIIRDLK